MYTHRARHKTRNLLLFEVDSDNRQVTITYPATGQHDAMFITNR